MTVQEMVSQLQNADAEATVKLVLKSGERVDLSVINIERTEGKSLVLLTTNDIQATLGGTYD